MSSPAHLIATMRSKMDYIQTQDSKGKTIIRKWGWPRYKDGMEYESEVGDLDIDHNLIISKTRCRALDGGVINKPGKELAETVKSWLSDGEPLPDKPTEAQSTRMMALVKELALDGSYMARLISDEYGKGKYNELTQDEAEGLNEMLEGMRQQAAS